MTGDEFHLGTAILMQSLVYMPFALAGWLRGWRARRSRYLAFVFDVLPRESRQALLEMAQEEAARAAHAAPRDDAATRAASV